MKNEKPKIEDVVCEVLSGDAQKNALDFISFLRENKLNPAWSAKNAWKVSSKTFSVCFIRLHGVAEYNNLGPGEWSMLPFIGEYDADALPDEDKEIAWANKNNCESCGQCALRLNAIFGKKFRYSCECAIGFRNPDDKAVACAKKIVMLRKNEIKQGLARKHQYVAIKDRV